MTSRRIAMTLATLLLAAPVAAQQDDADADADASARTAPAEASPVVAGKSIRVGSFLAASGDAVHMPPGASWTGNVHAAGGSIDIGGEVDGDVLIAGQSPAITGVVTGDAGMAGQTVRADGRVGGDLRIAGQNVSVNGAVGGDLVAFGQSLRVGAEARIEGPAILFAGFVTVVGEIGGPAHLAGGEVTIDGPVRGDVTVRCDQFRLGQNARIDGALTYESKNEPTIPDGVVAGPVSRIEKSALEEFEDLAERSEAASSLFSPFRLVLALYVAAITFLSGILFWLLFERLVRGALRRATGAAGFASSGIVGLVVGLGAIAIAAGCFLLGPLWLAIVAAALALFFFGGVVGRMILGRALLRLVTNDPHPLLALLAGIVGLLAASFVLGLVPWVGGLAAFALRAAVVVAGVGAIVQELRGRGAPGSDAPA